MTGPFETTSFPMWGYHTILTHFSVSIQEPSITTIQTAWLERKNHQISHIYIDNLTITGSLNNIHNTAQTTP